MRVTAGVPVFGWHWLRVRSNDAGHDPVSCQPAARVLVDGERVQRDEDTGFGPPGSARRLWTLNQRQREFGRLAEARQRWNNEHQPHSETWVKNP